MTPGTTYYFGVGGQDGHNGGGLGGANNGGGYTWFSSNSTYFTSTVILLAGGGGGAGACLGGVGQGEGAGNGGAGGGLSGTQGQGMCDGGACDTGGGGGTQGGVGSGGTGACSGANGSGSQGGAGGGSPCNGYQANEGGAGGGGYYGAGGGGSGGDSGTNFGGAGGGGGSSYIAASLTNASTTSGVNSGNGSLVITEIQDITPFVSSPAQYYENGVTPLSDGSSTGQNTVVFSATVGSHFAHSLQLQVEVEPKGTAFTNTANATSSFVANGAVATTSFTGTNGDYHWQYRVVDAQNNSSTWRQYYSGGSPVALSETPLYSDPNLVSYYPMEGDANDLADGNNGTVTNGSFGTEYGLFNQGENLPLGAYDLIAPSTSLEVATFTISVWAQFYQSRVGQGGLFGFYGKSGSFNRVYSLDANGHNATFYIANQPILSANGFDNGSTEWYHIVAEQSGGIASIYVNGSVVATTTSNATLNFGNPCGAAIGADVSGNSCGTEMTEYGVNVDDVSFWNRALSATEISDLHGGDWLSTMSDFTLAAPTVTFTTPTNGTTTANFPNWELDAANVTSTSNYNLQVDWGDTTGDPAVSSTLATNGANLMGGVSVPKPTSTFDYTYDGTPILINATATLMDASTTATVATSSISYTEDTTVAPLNCSASTVQCISYKYDNDGNITQVTDDSGTDAAKTVFYTYDNLNRLEEASSTGVATGTNYLYTYTYDPVGNLLSGPDGTYAYGGTGYPNPDAVTGITQGSSTITFSYDNNGNLASSSNGFAYTWDYNNRMIGVTAPSSTWSYGYDYTGQRVISQNGTSTSIYDPETTYSVTGSTATKNILVESTLASTIVGTGASSTAYTVLANNLGSSNVILNASGGVAELLDYYPYGSVRLDEQSGMNNRRKYIGQIYDGSTGLVYDNARYYSGTQGQFLSEDPNFMTDQTQRNLSDPQSLNAYSYSEDDPVTRSDPSGRQALLGLDDIAAYAIITSAPMWIPLVNNGVNAASTALTKWTDSWARSNSRQIQSLNVNTEPGDSGVPKNKKPNDNNNWKKGFLIGTGIIIGIGGYEEAFNSEQQSTMNFSNGNIGTPPPPPNTQNTQSPQRSDGQNSDSQRQSSEGGASNAELQMLQNILSQLQSILSQLSQQISKVR